MINNIQEAAFRKEIIKGYKFAETKHFILYPTKILFLENRTKYLLLMILHFYVIRFQNEVSYTIVHHNIAEKNALKRMKVEFDTVTFGFTKFFKCFEQKIM